MQPLHLFFLFTLSFCASIGGYDETPSKHLITQQQSYQIQQPTENQKKFYQKETQPYEACAITGPKTKNDCQQYELEDPDYKCCFISFSIGNYNNSIYQRVAYTAAAIGDMKFAFRHAKKVSILCDGFNIEIKYMLLVVAMIFLI